MMHNAMLGWDCLGNQAGQKASGMILWAGGGGNGDFGYWIGLPAVSKVTMVGGWRSGFST